MQNADIALSQADCPRPVLLFVVLQGLEALGGITHTAALLVRPIHIEQGLLHQSAVNRHKELCPKATQSGFPSSSAGSRVLRLLDDLWASCVALRFEAREAENLTAPPAGALRAFGRECASCPREMCSKCHAPRHRRIFPNQGGFWEDEHGDPHCACPVISAHPERRPRDFLQQCRCAAAPAAVPPSK